MSSAGSRFAVWRRVLPLSLQLLALGAGTALAQSNLGAITGIVTDPQNAIVPDATVTATKVATGLRTSTKSNSTGVYLLTSLPLGTYTVSVEHAGFSKYVREGISVDAGQRLGLDIALTVGAMEEAVSVTAQPPLIQDRTSAIDTTIEPKSIEALPLSGRKTLNVVALSGAAVFIAYPSTPTGSPSFTLAGGRGRSQMSYIDGGSSQNSRIGNPLIDTDLPSDAVAEVKLLANSASAEFGASAGGVVMTTTKSGTNELRGSLYENFRHDALDAPGFFAPIGSDGHKIAPELRYNVYGGTVGGPVRRNKTFFFFSYEGQRQRSGSTLTLTVPTLLQRQGDFSQTFNASGALIPIFDPATTTIVNGRAVRTQFPDNLIPQNRIDPVAAAILNFFPKPNQAPINLGGANNFSGTRVSIIPSDLVFAKIDHGFTERDRLTARYMRLAGTGSISSRFPNGGAGDPGPGSDFAERWAIRLFGNWTHTVNANQLNEFRFAYNDRLFHQLSAGLGGNYPSQLGLIGVPDAAFPQFAPASGFGAIGSTSQQRIESPIRTYQFIDNYSWIRGRHQFKFGGEMRRSFHGDLQQSTVSGAFAFSANGTATQSATSSSFSGGNGLATMLTGFVTSFTEVSTLELERHMYYFAAFAQDDWTVGRNLTLNLGLRWEADTPMIADDLRMNGFDPNQINPVSGTPGVVKFVGADGWPVAPYSTHRASFGPRVGIAWKPFSSKTVVRGGYGLFYAHPFDDSPGNAVALGFGTSANLSTPDNGITPAFFLRNGVPAVTNPTLNDSFGAVTVAQAAAGRTTNAVTYLDPDRAVGYSQQFNIGIQQELPGNMVVEVAALGNLSRNLSNANLSVNQIAPNVLSSLQAQGITTQLQQYRPFPQFTDVLIQFPTNGLSDYYALLVRADKRFSHGLSFGANYTWSSYLGNITQPGTALGNGVGSLIYQDYYSTNPRANYGPTADDIPQRLNFHWIYELPFGTGRRWLAGHPLRPVVGGWSLGNISTFQSGAPLTITTQTNTCNCFSAGPQRPNVTGDPNAGSHTVASSFNTAAFSQPAAYTFGTAGVGIVRGPGLIQVDISVIREVTVTDTVRTELRAEIFNLINHTNFGNPGTVFGSSTFGVISSALPARQVQLGLRLTF
ncbi:MAG: hypothetical protein DMG02_31315 [Acidobacteria bacterium]|nr:MAG: hypothetical protein DMG02_31315 [Acidobacteriota bacterium]